MYQLTLPFTGGGRGGYNTHKGNTMMTIDNATVETLDATQARPVGKTVLSVTIGEHTFDMLVDEDKLIQALASQYA